ncbi:MAG: hypothetical protein QF704_13290 [Anaerolineales bacterium]|jgi:hypothetical protein|nr:hypothetical protein [Anaerolineales bacterium]
MSLIRNILITLVVVLFAGTVHAEHIYKEKEYQECWCDKAGGVTEYGLPDKTRVDCLTDEYAIEFDFAEKWAEAIGQSLHYAEMTNRKPGIVLIIERKGDERHLKKLEPIARKNNIRIWIMKPSDIKY